MRLGGAYGDVNGPLTATQTNAARQFALAYGVTVETKSGTPGADEFADGATALGIVIAFSVLAASVGEAAAGLTRVLPAIPVPVPPT